jgi:quinol monooxygenase YgiN
MHVVTVTFRLHPGATAAFLPLMRANADTSLGEEPGCHRFDVCTDPDDPLRVFLYELYRDRAAFDAHLTSTHFRDFSTATAHLIADKSVQCYELDL